MKESTGLATILLVKLIANEISIDRHHLRGIPSKQKVERRVYSQLMRVPIQWLILNDTWPSQQRLIESNLSIQARLHPEE